MNTSKVTRDFGRPLSTIMAEKALAGAIPVQYSLLPHARSAWQRTDWQNDPNLMAVEFSDGSTVQVASAEAMAESRRLQKENSAGQNSTGSATGDGMGNGGEGTVESETARIERELREGLKD